MGESQVTLQLGEEMVAIQGYEGLYSITSYGRVWIPEKIGKFGRGYRKYKSKFKKLNLDKDGYFRVNLYKKGKSKTYKIHRLVAIHYKSNPLNLPEVNHKDGVKANCREDNLEWCTYDFNMKHAMENNLKHPHKKNKYYGVYEHKNLKVVKWVVQIKVKGKLIYLGSYKTELEAAQVYNDFVEENNLNRLLNKLEEN